MTLNLSDLSIIEESLIIFKLRMKENTKKRKMHIRIPIANIVEEICVPFIKSYYLL
jgi:hypothetical protein